MSADSISAARRWKQAHPDFPLLAHATGRWGKKIKGELKYFGPITEDIAGSAQAALNDWCDKKDDLLAGRKPRPRGDGAGPTVAAVCDQFLTAKTNREATGEISPHTLRDYERICKLLVSEFGDRPLSDLEPGDFEALRSKLAKTLGPVALGNHVQRIRTVLRHGRDSKLNDMLAESFKKPTRKTLRIARAKQGAKMYEAADVRTLLDKSGLQLRCMILLAMNAGLGNSDCGQLPIDAVDLETAWLDFPRPKTGIERRCPLWPETVKAIRDVLSKRKAPVDPAHAGLLFVTKRGGTFAKETSDNPISKEFKKALRAAGLEQTRRNFYSLRHTFRTVADGNRDQVAANYIMGHADDSMAAAYREKIDDERLEAVVAHVRAWLFPKPAKAKPKKGAAAKAKREPQRKAWKASKSLDSGRPQLRIVG